MLAVDFKRPLFWERLLGVAGVALTLAGIAILSWAQLVSDARLLTGIQTDVQSALDERFAAIAAHQPSKDGLPVEAFPNILVQEYHTTYGLQRWSSRKFSPSSKLARLQLRFTNNELLNDEQYLFYNHKKQVGDLVYFYLIPLRIDPPIQNEYLQNYLFLEPFSDEVQLEVLFQSHQLSLQPTQRAINLNNERGQHLISFVLNDTTPFRLAWLKLGLGLLIGGGVVLLLTLRLWLNRHGLSSALADLIVLAVLVSSRVLMFFIGLPVALYQTEFFSSQVLAMSNISPSLGDFSMNLLLVLLFALYLFRYWPWDEVLDWIAARGRLAEVVSVVLSSMGIALVFGGVFVLLNRAVQNSQVSLQLSDFYSLSWASWLLLVDIAMLFGSLSLLMLMHVRLMLFASRRPLLMWLIAFTVMAAVALVPVTLRHGLSLSVVPTFALSLLLLSFVWQAVWTLGEWRLLHTFGVVFVLAILSNQLLNISIEREIQAEIKAMPERFVEQKNILTESAFDGVVRAIQSDRFLWQRPPDTTAQLEFPFLELARSLTSRHLLSAFKQYDTRVFFFKNGRRVDENLDQKPYRLNAIRRRSGRTLSPDLYRVPYSKSVTQNIYVGEIQVRSREFGRLQIQIELHPKANVSNRLYPQLLLDANIKQQLRLPPNLSVAVYVDSQLVRQEGTQLFPLSAKELGLESGLDGVLVREEQYTQLVDVRKNNRIIVVRAQRPSLFNRLTTFSILFYFYAVLLMLAYVPSLVRDWQSAGYSLVPGSLAKRMQFFLLVLTLVPMIVMWLLTVPLFERFFNESTVEDSRSTLVQAGGYLESEPAFVSELELATQMPGGSMASQDFITQMSEILGVDLNIYDYLGRLYLTTRPKIFEAGLVSKLINPEAYRQLLEERLPYLIVEENIGELSYYSGYIPIKDENNEIEGFVNIPFLLQQDLLRRQLRNFVAYLINVYVVMILIMATAGIFISRSLTNPLRLLREKLVDTRFGLHNEPIQWQRKDEIGSIVEAYNEMLAQFEASERKLAKSEREIAWREMARQVAHEIKNPLTPMKLSIQQLERILQHSDDEKIKQFGERYAKTLLAQIDSLTAIANSFSQFATMPVAATDRLNLNDVLREAYTLYLQEESVHFEYIPLEDQLYIAGDKNQLMRVLVNLIRNAIQAEADKLVLTLDQDENEAVIRLKDNGKGIPLNIQQKVFEPNFSTKTSGMGLGLAITKRIIEAMKGDIRFESTPEVGTTFSIRFPLHDANELHDANAT